MTRYRPLAEGLIVLGATAGATAVCTLLDGRMSVAGLAMVYLATLVLTATLLSRGASIAASLLCVSALNFFFVPPRYTFDVEGTEYWWTLAVLLGVSLALNTLIAFLREGRTRAQIGEARAAQLHALSEVLAQSRGHEEAARHACEWLQAALGHPAAVFLREIDGEPLRCWCAADTATFHPRAAQWAVEHGLPLGRGCEDWPQLPLWCAPFARHGAAGAVQVLLDGPAHPQADVLLHWQALARQVGLSVERERASAAANLAQQSAQAEAARNTLLASLSHDLRTPLAGIVGSASTLRAQARALTEGQRDMLLANLENEARDMTLMADNVLQMARLSQPQLHLKKQWESIEEVLGTAVGRMRRRWSGARIKLAVAAGLPPVQAEAALLAQVIANLVDNAVRHGGAEPQVALQAGRSREGIFIAVRDHGPGVPQEQLNALFERYRHGRAIGDAGGAGLGLAICKLIVEAHGGRIQACRCEPGVEFRIDLPVAREPLQQEAQHG